METVLLIRYAEIHLKGLNRPYFERSLGRARRALAPCRCGGARTGAHFVFGVPGSGEAAASCRACSASIPEHRARGGKGFYRHIDAAAR